MFKIENMLKDVVYDNYSIHGIFEYVVYDVVYYIFEIENPWEYVLLVVYLNIV